MALSLLEFYQAMLIVEKGMKMRHVFREASFSVSKVTNVLYMLC